MGQSNGKSAHGIKAVEDDRHRDPYISSPRVIGEESRVIPRTQMPDHWRTWTNRGRDCVLMALVWQFLVLPGVPRMLESCNGPLSKMLKSISKKKRRFFGPGRFTKCGKLARLLGYSASEATGERSYHAIPTMVRLLLTLSAESEGIRERFLAHTVVTRVYDNGDQRSVELTAPFIIVQKRDFDYISDGHDLLTQARTQPQDQVVRMQHQAYASWMREIFAVARFRRAAGLGHEHDDFFTCGEGKDLSLSFKLRHMDEKATHVVFLLPEPSTAWLDEKGLLRTGPDAAGYPGQVSLGRNRAVWYVSPDDARDGRLWELYSVCLATLIQPDVDDSPTDPIGHSFPQWYPHGAKPPPGAAICNTFERRSPNEFEAIYSAETSNRNAPAQTMAFVATSRTQPR